VPDITDFVERIGSFVEGGSFESVMLSSLSVMSLTLGEGDIVKR